MRQCKSWANTIRHFQGKPSMANFALRVSSLSFCLSLFLYFSAQNFQFEVRGFTSPTSWSKINLSVSLDKLSLSRTIKFNYVHSWYFFISYALEKVKRAEGKPLRKIPFLTVSRWMVLVYKENIQKKQPIWEQKTQTSVKDLMGVAFSLMNFRMRNIVDTCWNH